MTYKIIAQFVHVLLELCLISWWFTHKHIASQWWSSKWIKIINRFQYAERRAHVWVPGGRGYQHISPLLNSFSGSVTILFDRVALNILILHSLHKISDKSGSKKCCRHSGRYWTLEIFAITSGPMLPCTANGTVSRDPVFISKTEQEF